MKLVSGMSGIIAPFRPGQGLSDLKKEGFENLLLDLTLFCPTSEIAMMGKKKNANEPAPVRDLITEHPEKMLEYPQLLVDETRKNGLDFALVQAPIYVRGEDGEDYSDFVFDRVIDSMKLCQQVGCHYLIVLPSVNNQSEIDTATQWYEKLAPFAMEYDVSMLVSNYSSFLKGRSVRGLFSDPYELARWIDRENEKWGREVFGVLYDIGGAVICGQDMQEMVQVLGNRIKAIALRENDGRRGAAMLPFTYTYAKTDYLGLIRGLRNINFDGLIYLDASSHYGSFSTLLRPALLHLVKEVGSYFVWQIGMEKGLKKYTNRVLFGAGNMCRNYMKCYGEEYPPLFTCDNNKKIWGTEFCGIEVKSPEALKDLPEDCVIYICNVYYREIATQLREMGITNPIENFNDEYLPSFYTDKIAYRYS